MSGPLPEPEVPVGTSRREWIALLAGPSLWFGHFMAVYLLGEAACAADLVGPEHLGLPVLSWVIVASTVVALGLLVWAAVQTASYRRTHDGGQLLGIGLALDALFALAIVLTGLSVVVLPPC